MENEKRIGQKLVRTREPQRAQGWLFRQTPEGLVGAEHPVRLVAAAVEKLDLGGIFHQARAVQGRAGRPLTSPHLLLSVWLYGIQQGVGEATELARRCREDAAFEWLCGGVEVSHDKLSQFRAEYGEVLQQVFTQVVGLLVHHELVSLETVAQDGTRVRASASAPSFRREASLQACREQAELHLEVVLAQADDNTLPRRQKAAREAAARDYQRRVDEALGALERERAKKKSAKDKRQVRASTTDADARVMKMADGGFRPGYNVQLAVAGKAEGGPRTIVGVQVTNVGSDAGSVGPMLEQIEARTGQLPAHLLADANHATVADLKTCADKGVDALIAVPERMARAREQGDHSAQVEAWRERMQTPEAQELYRGRASLVENVNAQVKQHYGLEKLLVRGLDKVTSVALLTALAHNLLAHGQALVNLLS
ncbi:transposase [Archangium sp.]|uniref:transposase n=2 Tax=Archangium sp. TaxID=1872627 RepID=UPI00389A27CA